jgi:hypothetical protein
MFLQPFANQLILILVVVLQWTMQRNKQSQDINTCQDKKTKNENEKRLNIDMKTKQG